MFVYHGHGDASYICGAAPQANMGNVTHTVTKYRDIVNAISEHPNVRNKTKLIVFDCCRDGGGVQTLNTSTETFVALATKLGAGSWICEDEGCLFTAALADKLVAKTRTHDVDTIFMELRR
eukprot:2879150-Prymnesium_polylepis.1